VCVLTYDVRGHGKSPVSLVDVSIELLAMDVIALLDHLGIDRVDFAGVSLGGIVGQWLGARAPDRINRLLLASTAAKLGTAWNARIATVNENGLSAIVDGAIGRWFTEGFVEREPDVIQRFRRILLDTPRAGYLHACAAIRDADQRALVRDIAVPTLVVAGSADVVTRVDDAAWLAEHIPGATMTTLRAAHLANVEVALAFNDSMLDFFLGPEVNRGR
jgi:3-oxoadipate enol-lactonase